MSLETWKLPAPQSSRTQQYLAVKVHFSVNFRAFDVVVGCTPIEDAATGSIDTLRLILDQYFEVSAVLWLPVFFDIEVI